MDVQVPDRGVVPAIPVARPAENGRRPGALPPQGVVDESLNIGEIVRVIRRHLLLVAACAMAFGGIMAWMAYRTPPRYESTATVRLADLRSNLTAGLDGAASERVGGGRRDPLLSQMEVMRSRTVMGQVVDREGLRVHPVAELPAGLIRDVRTAENAPADTIALRFGAGQVEARAGDARAAAAYGAPVTLRGVSFVVDRRPAVAEGELVVVPRAATINGLLGGLRARPRPDTDLFDLLYTAGDPQTARRVLDAVVEEFQRLNAEQARLRSRRRREFIEEQLVQSDQEVAGAQLALTEFRRARQVYSSREQIASEQQGLRDLEVRREELEADRQTSRQLLAAAERGGSDTRALRSLVSSPAVAGNPVINQLYDQLMEYEAERDTLTTGRFRAAAESPQVQRVNQLIAGTQARIADAVRSQIQSQDARIAALDAIRDRRTSRMGGLPELEAEEERLTQQLVTLQEGANGLRAELQKARIAEAVEIGQVEVIDRASMPGAPVPQHQGLRILFGVLVGLGVGGVAALLREKMNTTVSSREELEEILGVAALAVIPQIHHLPGGNRLLSRNGKAAAVPRIAGTVDPSVVVASNSHTPGAEAYRTLRTNLLFSQSVRLRSLVVTSSGPADGKTTTSSNVAATFAQQGMRVVLVDCDLRRPRIHEVFGLEKEPGLSQLILGFNGMEDVIRPSGIENLSVISSGTPPPNPSELLGSERMLAVLRELGSRFDLMVLDTPPVLLAPEAAVLAAGADGVVLVARAGSTQRAAAQDAAQQLHTVGAHLVGSVLNDPDAKLPGYSSYYAYRYYGYSYGQQGKN
jgi:capsular exopolysaccharide synthesis family protein